jgi:hypothetical protein
MLTFMLLPVLLTAQQKKSKSRPTEKVTNTEETQMPPGLKPLAIKGAPLPSFTFVTAQQTRMTLEQLPSDKPVLLALFNPMCDHCQKVATTIRDHIKEFEHVTILFVTGMNFMNELANFSKLSGIETFPNFIVCSAQEEFTEQLFEAKGIPQIMLYNRDHLLQKTYYENITVKDVLNYLK